MTNKKASLLVWILIFLIVVILIILIVYILSMKSGSETTCKSDAECIELAKSRGDSGLCDNLESESAKTECNKIDMAFPPIGEV